MATLRPTHERGPYEKMLFQREESELTAPGYRKRYDVLECLFELARLGLGFEPPFGAELVRVVAPDLLDPVN